MRKEISLYISVEEFKAGLTKEKKNSFSKDVSRQLWIVKCTHDFLQLLQNVHSFWKSFNSHLS